MQKPVHANEIKTAAPSANCSAVIVHDRAAPYRLIAPAGGGGRKSRVIATSPHSGRQYPAAFIADAAMALEELRGVEDAGVDRLLQFQPLPAPLLLAEFPRSFVDLNRDAGELDAAMFDGAVAHGNAATSRYLRWGLGVIPKYAASRRNIYNKKLPAREAAQRLAHYYHPFHRALAGLIRDARENREGHALLIDCHSMPSSVAAQDADIVIGSDFGKSARDDITNKAHDFFTREGLRVALNTPYAGGHITRHYGRPDSGVSALQIEIARRLYLDERKIQLKKGWQEIASVLCRFILFMDGYMEMR